MVVRQIVVAPTRAEVIERLGTLVRAATNLRNITPRDPNTAVAVARIEAEIDRARTTLGYGVNAAN
jgi:hypothetical protein